MDRLFTKILIFASIWNLILPANLFASNKAIVITPVMDGKSDNISKDLSKSFSDFFIKKGFQVVSNEKVNAILDYYRLDREAKDKSEATKNIEDSIIKAKEHYYNFEYAEAGAQIKYAIEQLEKGDADNGRLLRDAYIIAGMITKSGKKKEGETSFFFKKALTLDPGYQLDEKNFSPSVVDVFNEVKSEQLKLSSGTIRIESDPKVAEDRKSVV